MSSIEKILLNLYFEKTKKYFHVSKDDNRFYLEASGTVGSEPCLEFKQDSPEAGELAQKLFDALANHAALQKEVEQLRDERDFHQRMSAKLCDVNVERVNQVRALLDSWLVKSRDAPLVRLSTPTNRPIGVHCPDCQRDHPECGKPAGQLCHYYTDTLERYAFEAWLARRGICEVFEAVNSSAVDSYANQRIDLLWNGWKGRARS